MATKKERVNPYKAAEEARKKKEAEEAAKKAAQEAQSAPKVEEVVTTPAEPEKAQEPAPAPVSEPIPEQEAVTPEEKAFVEDTPDHIRNLLDDLIPKQKKPKRGTYGFYLDGDVHEEIIKRAEQSDASKSEYLNALLRRVFFGE